MQGLETTGGKTATLDSDLIDFFEERLSSRTSYSR